METMAFFDRLTAALKYKWLPFYQENRAWITRQMSINSVETPDGGRRPSSYLILGVVSALEPELAELMLPFTKLNSDVDKLIDVLDLNFDPELYLNNHYNAPAEAETMAGLLDTADEVLVVGPDEESVIIVDTAEADDLSEWSELDEIISEEPKSEPSELPAPPPTGENRSSAADEISRLFPNF